MSDFQGNPQENPGDLRAKLEEALREKNQLAEENHSFKVGALLQEKNFDLVKAEDLKGVPLGEAEAKATAIQQERVNLQQELVSQFLKKSGVDETQIKEFVEGLHRSNESVSEAAQATDRARQLGRMDATPLPPMGTIDQSQVHGLDAIRAGLAKNLQSTP